METKSIREIINIFESLNVDDKVKFKDNKETEYSGDVVEIQKPLSGDKKEKLIKGDNNTEDCVLELIYDPEGGPVTVKVSFEDNSSNELTSIRLEN